MSRHPTFPEPPPPAAPVDVHDEAAGQGTTAHDHAVRHSLAPVQIDLRSKPPAAQGDHRLDDWTGRHFPRRIAHFAKRDDGRPKSPLEPAVTERD
jgi:hypothetical protein